ncbi:NACHT domain-containing protein [Rhodopseudomonas sp. AAP120]|uniref:NACHT domain-containing protein n=1 Tax=Rhodopseudomonas sp. AAP120 TaxID=1523430 RepID=UPI000A50DCA2|nr:NACHT domain-containing protein [Rhodopseudomonas sp. AAP120]
MKKQWASFEDRVRDIASHIWGRPCTPKRVGGVNLDGVVVLDSEIHCFIEMTENRTIAKVREDVIKLQTAKNSAFGKGILARCFCVINGTPTPGMVDAGVEQNIRVLSIDDFTKMFFDFSSYRVARDASTFGSAVNPLTGLSDETKYVPVRYLVEGRKTDAGSADIANFLRDGKTVVLLGEYGSGKSRCIREVFRILSADADESFCYPVAVDLRKSWGLGEKGEIIRRHFHDLGLDNLQSMAIKAFNAGSMVLLLDGFDEIGSQAWSNDDARLKVIRAKSLEGVKDIVVSNRSGTLVAGREHYFSNTEEMLSALGASPKDLVVIRAKNEFSDTELLEYFSNLNIEADIPEWLPRRPLICQTISDLASDQFDAMFGEEGNEIEFWNHFILVLCRRDASIHISFDPDTIYRMFVHLARLTRSKNANVGPISLHELQVAFEFATGAAPVEEASAMLQRLPSLGRISAESNDRQFVDIYILDGLRARDVANSAIGGESAIQAICSSKWTNPLGDLGQRVLSQDPRLGDKTKLSIARRAFEEGNVVLASDVIASLVRSNAEPFDFENFELFDGNFISLTLSERAVSNLKIRDSVIGELKFPASGWSNSSISNCLVSRVAGLASAAALPNWVKADADHFDSVESISRIRRIGLKPAQEILVTIIRKTFFQKGAGRKEEALLRGLSTFASKSTSTKIINILSREGLLESFRGSEGTVYTPVRSQTRRMQKILDELGSSEDPIWIEVSQL